ncbi:MAG: L-threonylcarbamoyladenylate synthase [Candidatus Omnitrophica bacterium]|nr:L-threonylcarbamoyladenylate synthase [Candidatus Omnitrophota bacterium]
MTRTTIIKIDHLGRGESYASQAAGIIRSGGLVIIPTETVYGIAANMLDKKAIERLIRIKGRPQGKHFSLHIHKKETVDELAKDIPVAAYKLMDRFWPGPLTLVFRSKDQGTIGMRMPDSEIAFKIIADSGVPVVCPSANISGRPAPVNFQDAIKGLSGLVDLAIDAGNTRIGVESSVVDVTQEPLRILREGAIQKKDIEETANKKTVLFICTGNSCRSVMAEALLKKMLSERNRSDVEVLSAGTMMNAGLPATEQTKEVLKRENIDVSGHISRQVSREIINRSDIILVMEKTHEGRVLEMAPEARNRLFLLKEFAKINEDGLDIEDPIGKSMEFYSNIFNTIKQALERIIDII